MKLKRAALLIAFLSLLIAFVVNEANLHALRAGGVTLREGETVVTNDDISYYWPMRSYLRNGNMYNTHSEMYSSITRPPGYGFLWYFFALIAGEHHALLLLKLFQLLLFSISVYCFILLARAVLKSDKWSLIIGGIYGLCPFTMGFLYYTLTEGVTPALVIFYLFFLIIGGQKEVLRIRIRYYLLAACIFALLFLIRPALGLIGILLPWYLWKDPQRPMSLRFTFSIPLFVLLALSLQGAWQIRNRVVLGHLTSLHPVYQNELPGTFRPVQAAVWDFYKGWEDKGNCFHEAWVPFWHRTMAGDSSLRSIDSMTSLIPADVREKLGEDRINAAFVKAQKAVYDQKPYYDYDLVMPSQALASEDTAVAAFSSLQRDLKKNFPLRYYLITPLKVLRNMIFHSNLSLYLFQHSLRGSLLGESLRWICFILHSLIFCLFAGMIFLRKKAGKHLLLPWIPLMYLLYLAFIQRGIEERYTLPMLSVTLLCATFVFMQIFFYLQKIIHKTKSPDE
jgi:hypothetical protein